VQHGIRRRSRPGNSRAKLIRRERAQRRERRGARDLGDLLPDRLGLLLRSEMPMPEPLSAIAWRNRPCANGERIRSCTDAAPAD
jgi:hypothetical protein